jgi:hypothetical protein
MCPPPATKPPSLSGAPQRQLHTNGAQREQNTQQRAVRQQPASPPHPHPPTVLASKPMMHHHEQPKQLQSAKKPSSTAINLRGTLILPLSALSSGGREHTLSPRKTRPSIEGLLMAFCHLQMCWAPPLPRELVCMTAEISRAVPPYTGRRQMLPWACPRRPRTKGCAYALGCRARQATISQSPLCSEVVQDTDQGIDFGKCMTVSESDNDAAWALRKAFDDVLASNNSSMPRVYSMTSNPVHHHKQTQKPQNARAGLPNSQFLQQPHHHSMHQHGQHAPSVPFAPQQVHCLCMFVPRHPS